jgi:hypothetical protein
VQIRVIVRDDTVEVVPKHNITLPNWLHPSSTRDLEIFATAHRKEKGHVGEHLEALS